MSFDEVNHIPVDGNRKDVAIELRITRRHDKKQPTRWNNEVIEIEYQDVLSRIIAT